MRQIPIALQQNLDGDVQYIARCIRFRLKSGEVMGFAMWDADITYDHGDGFGPTTYSAAQGIDQSMVESDISYSIANSEGRVLAASDFLNGLTVEMVEAGVLDDAEWDCFILDWRNPVTGSAMILDAGDVGEVRTEDGLVIIPELLSYSMRLKQPVGHYWQRPCRAIFGTPANSQTGCGVDADALWESAEVQSVAAENNRTFTGEGTAYFPGRVIFTSGQNQGKVYSVESVSGSTITLAQTTPYAITAGDEYDHRPDCTKWPDGALGCKSYENFLNYKGEHLIPVGDGAAGSTPGAQLPGGGGWVGEVPADQVAE